MKEIAKNYNPQEFEQDIYSQWEKSGFFNPDNLNSTGESFTVSMPPPNVTGILHLGHALENSLMDIEIRYQRMKGKKALLVPGTDHAAVATQARVENMLKKQGMDNPRQELGREELLKRIREYAEHSKSTILSQIKRLGTSCDWSRLAYTFDEDLSKAVYILFKKMYEDGLIYRGYRVINWSTKGQSTCSDDELVYIDQKTKVYTFKYAKDFPIPIATTRPETKLGDTAVAVHPKDNRYKKYIGQKFIVDIGAKKPLTITIIADQNVDPEYGTGAVGVTPAHSQIDFEMYQKNKDIGLIQVIGMDGKMTAEAGENYQGLSILEAREKFVKWLKDNDLYIAEEEVDHSVGTSDRFGDIVEALPMDQWFIDVNKTISNKNKSLKDLMREAVTVGHNGDIKKKIIITPERYHNIYLGWIDNLRDWNISRQIWWGHRIPIWYKGDEVMVSDTRPDGDGWVQDEDTLDTWFSSGAWTFSTLGWPNSIDKSSGKVMPSSDLAKYHPTAWMQMGYEILFFWMARMILMTTYALDDIPFKDVYIHGMLRAEDGRKFSKSLGNGFDPIEMVDKYGADALRLSLIKGVTPGNDSKFYEEKVEAGRNFVNKLWNISRFILTSVDDLKLVEKQPRANSIADEWVLRELNILITKVTNDLYSYHFSAAIESLYDFTWSKFADWYIEISKIEKNKNEILLYILQNLLKMWHPFAPFVTEVIWQNFSDELLMVNKWPDQVDNFSAGFDGSNKFDAIRKVITWVRNSKAVNNIGVSKKIKIYFDDETDQFIRDNIDIISSLAKVELVNKFEDNWLGGHFIDAGSSRISCRIEIDREQNAKIIAKQKEELERYISTIKKKLDNENFVKNAPAEVVEEERKKLQEAIDKLAKL